MGGYMATGIAGRLPQLVPGQVLKLKQLTVLSLTETSKVLPYDLFIQELDVTNVCELEDFLINERMHVVGLGTNGGKCCFIDFNSTDYYEENLSISLLVAYDDRA
ncbi:hypothetical protein HAX54_049176 [Datura stramonium]|uniref:Uncharacterized protein n=1 Tax=Datura stramonium TaxID=4076 RepID=A0ABS8WP65_DATST|nr:hypothetical protein [Datura stramonium]